MGRFFEALMNVFDAPAPISEEVDYIDFIIPAIVFYFSKVIAGVALLVLRHIASIWYKIFVALLFASTIFEIFLFSHSYWVKRYLVCMTIINLLMIIYLLWKYSEKKELSNRSRYNKKDFGDDDMESLLGEDSTTATAPTTSRSAVDMEQEDNATMCTPRRTTRPPYMYYDRETDTFPEPSELKTKRKAPQSKRPQPSDKIRKQLFSNAPTQKLPGSSIVSIASRDDDFLPLPESPICRDIDVAKLTQNFLNEQDHCIIEIPCDLLDLDNLPKQLQNSARSQEVESDVAILPVNTELKAQTLDEDGLCEIVLQSEDLIDFEVGNHGVTEMNGEKQLQNSARSQEVESDVAILPVNTELEAQPLDEDGLCEIVLQSEDLIDFEVGNQGATEMNSENATEMNREDATEINRALARRRYLEGGDNVHIPCELLELGVIPLEWLDWEKSRRRNDNE